MQILTYDAHVDLGLTCLHLGQGRKCLSAQHSQIASFQNRDSQMYAPGQGITVFLISCSSLLDNMVP